jgi:hypothetical protein
MRTHNLFILTAAAVLSATPALAQTQVALARDTTPAAPDTTTAAPASTKAERTWLSTQPKIEIQHLRAADQRGINVFETPKDDGVAYSGFKLNFGAAFTQQFQALNHSNTAAPAMTTVNGVEVNNNELMDIGMGFNNANANLNLNAQLAPGIRVALTTYLSSRHHNETWVKDGYLLIDASPFDVAAFNTLMQYVTVKAGHFEVNYGDAHFRRTDNGNAMYNPFVGNYIMDAFTTEVGAEGYVRTPQGLLAMVGVTGGEIRGNVTRPDDRGPAFLGKVGFDRQFTPAVRARLTGSVYAANKSPASTLYAGDRAGSRYYMVLENAAATESGQFTSGLINPGFRREVTALMVNPFVKVGGLELFGLVERATGRGYQPAPNALEPEAGERTFDQYAVDAVYRFLPGERVYVGGRYNAVKGELAGIADEVSVDRVEVGGGWFITPGIMLKGEYVTQSYDDFPTRDIRSGGKFNGFVVEGVVAF